ncbi:hypothetical protein [Aquimarina addita]|uniref:hypothetical protein n=1 Tax=Aquimarina addita TaxID=870485 RepID=UPI0031EE335F
MTDAQQEYIVARITMTVHANSILVRQVLQDMNPPLSAEGEDIRIHRNTMMRLQKRIEQLNGE